MFSERNEKPWRMSEFSEGKMVLCTTVLKIAVFPIILSRQCLVSRLFAFIFSLGDVIDILTMMCLCFRKLPLC